MEDSSEMPMCRRPGHVNSIAVAIMTAVDSVNCRSAAELNPADTALWKIIARHQSLRTKYLLSGAAEGETQPAPFQRPFAGPATSPDQAV